MAQSNATPQPASVLPSWEKIKAGVKGFFKTAIAYIPRGLLFLGLLYGGSALLGSVTPNNVGDFFNTAGLAKDGMLVGRMGFALLIGGLISGGIGAYESVAAVDKAHQAKQLQPEGNARTQDVAAQPQQEVSFGIAPPRHLPLGTEKINAVTRQ